MTLRMDGEDEIVCPVCHKEFATKYSMHRHMQTVHPKRTAEMEEVDEDYSSGDDDDDDGPDSDEAQEGNETAKSTEAVADDDDDDDLCTQAWRYVLKEAFEDMHEQPEALDDLTKEPHLSEFIESLQKCVQFYDATLHNLMSSHEYKQLQNTSKRMKKLGCSSQEADENAWHIRKLLIKNLLKSNMDALEEEEETDSDMDDKNSEN